MKKIQKSIPLPDDLYINHYFLESHVFFDIETTGFSPKNSFVYLIGMAARKENTIVITQFFAQSRREEQEVLSAFSKALRPFEVLITFNGSGFDIPFLKSRESLYEISNNWNAYESLDLYKLTGKFAHLFQLPDKKQKSLEKFLGIYREDTYNGGELISVYYNYEKLQDSHSRNLLLLHNYEDVLGMTKLLSLLAYRDFFETPLHILHAKKQDSISYGNSSEECELLLTLEPPLPFPKQILCQNGLCSLMCSGSSAKLLIKIFQGELKFYYENYKDYYYLPDEDMAIHKSVASFVDSGHKKKATAGTCYTKKGGCFLPQPKPNNTPCFYPGKKSGVSYFEMTEEFLSDPDRLCAYAARLLDVFKKK